MFLDQTHVGTKPDVFSLESLIAWLEKQPGDNVYCYDDAGHCLHAQYFTAKRLNWSSLGNVCVLIDGGYRDLPASFQMTAQQRPHTFGAALDRARKALAERVA